MKKSSYWVFKKEFKRQKRPRESPKRCEECQTAIKNGEIYIGEVWVQDMVPITFRRHNHCTKRPNRNDVWCIITTISLSVPATS